MAGEAAAGQAASNGGQEPIPNEVLRSILKVTPQARIRARHIDLHEQGAGIAIQDLARMGGLGVETVRWHLKQIYEKLPVRCRTEGALKFLGMKEGGA